MVLSPIGLRSLLTLSDQRIAATHDNALQRYVTQQTESAPTMHAGDDFHDHIAENDTTDVCMDTFGGYERYHECAPSLPSTSMHVSSRLRLLESNSFFIRESQKEKDHWGALVVGP